LDGSQVIYSLSGIQARALNCYEMKRYPAVTLDEQANAVQQELFRVSFGRKLGDQLYWLDPARFQNPTLRVTVSMTIQAATGFVTNTTVITAVVWTWDDRPATRAGHFVTKEYKNFTSAASGDDRGNLPVDMPWRMIVLRAFENQIAFHTDITQVKLTLDTDAYVPFDLRAEQLRDLNDEWFGRFHIPFLLDKTDGDTHDLLMAYPLSLSINTEGAANMASIDARTIDRVTLQVIDFSTIGTPALETTDDPITIDVLGLGPHFAFALPFGDPDDPETWFNPAGHRTMEMVLTQGGAGAAVSYFGQQVAP